MEKEEEEKEDVELMSVEEELEKLAPYARICCHPHK